MNIDVRFRGIEPTARLIDHVHARSRRAFARRTDRAWDARIHLEDVNGPRGGIDKRCVVHLRGPAVAVVAESRADDVEAALDGALASAERRLARVTGRQQAQRRPGRAG
ncbi:MAG: HPF/RaiA family ribosome-associated protein [Myxococcales bacterium]|nr:HPF/RaiA family ribosome-associated protein [Myxococcales bacterium]